MRVIRTGVRAAAMQQKHVLEKIRDADMRAYALVGTTLFGGLLDFPLPTEGPSFVTVGYWKTADARRARTRPVVTIGTAAHDDQDALAHRLQLRSEQEHRLLPTALTVETPLGSRRVDLLAGRTGEGIAEFDDGDTLAAVIVRDVDAAPHDLTVVRAHRYRDDLISEWVSLVG